MIYLDNNATTRPRPEVIEAMTRAFADAYANPGSRHVHGRAARQALEDSRESIARILNASPTEVVFTSGGTEATNMALFGFAGERILEVLFGLASFQGHRRGLRSSAGRGGGFGLLVAKAVSASRINPRGRSACGQVF